MCNLRKSPYSPLRRDSKLLVEEGYQKTKKIIEMYETSWNFQRGGGSEKKIPSMLCIYINYPLVSILHVMLSLSYCAHLYMCSPSISLHRTHFPLVQSPLNTFNYSRTQYIHLLKLMFDRSVFKC